ncbi:MAG: hypothetical protein D8M57_16130 [Candidatus Scalindua sp. AMX11]|nr:MAG: hypothetical protein DWQ00_03605 [Candidatus Scalindua sp.]NOG82802.1 hypothetical protein [Planctomycetota bacterium]RZV69030.1 MAG: hypothetical protein EX341_16295 [Candidatus Scalindua sp. SCAELEC01]TDE63861.1 MAG: hypothetical protein D8M57_16130 [Candidatus Scalindua sp. AMX11]GJQ60425.1 MAG: hypothetical protein SCALA701_32260 [Candidatus Scalindua sp.]
MFVLKRISIVFVLIFLHTSFAYCWDDGSAKETTLQDLKASIVELTASIDKIINILDSDYQLTERTVSLTELNKESNKDMIDILKSNNQLTEQIVNLIASSKESNQKMESLTNRIFWLTVVMIGLALMQIDTLKNLAKNNLNKLLNCTIKPFKNKQK